MSTNLELQHRGHRRPDIPPGQEVARLGVGVGGVVERPDVHGEQKAGAGGVSVQRHLGEGASKKGVR